MINKEAWPSTKTLPLANKKQIETYFEQAKEFIAKTHFYQSMRGDAVCAVAEYIAYQEGYTIRKWNCGGLEGRF